MEIEKLDINAVCFGILCNFTPVCGEKRAKEAVAVVRSLQSENDRLRRGSCPAWELAVRKGLRCCSTCRYYGPDADTAPICHRYLVGKKPCGFCDEWEGYP